MLAERYLADGFRSSPNFPVLSGRWYDNIVSMALVVVVRVDGTERNLGFHGFIKTMRN